MSEPLGPHNLHERLSAYADGELDAIQTRALLAHLDRDPASRAFLRDQERLRQAARRVVGADLEANTVPDALREKLFALAADKPASSTADDSTEAPTSDERIIAVIRRIAWTAAGIAAGIMIGLGWASYDARHPGDEIARGVHNSTTEPTSNADIVPIAMSHELSGVHLTCSRVDEAIHSGDYPNSSGELSAIVRRDLGGDAAHPDLSSLGFHYVGAGPCTQSFPHLVHLLYKTRGPHPRAISVFVEANHGQFAMAAGRLYVVPTGVSMFPIYAWRTETVAYFLVADDVGLADAARTAIRTAPPATGT